MDLDSPFGMLIFFSIFEVLGGAALGVALRGLVRRDFSGLFFLIWGGGFAGIPLIIGAASFLAMEAQTFFLAQVFILLTTVVTVALLPTDFLQTRADGNSGEAGAIVGAVLTMIGGAVVLFNLREGVSIGLVIGGIIAFLGIVILLRTAFGILRST